MNVFSPTHTEFSTFRKIKSSKKVFSTLAYSSEGVRRSVRPPAHGRHAVHHVRQAAGQLHQVQGDLISLSTCSLLTESCLSGLEPHRRDPWQDQRDTGKQGHPSNCCQHQGNDNAITKNTERRKIKRNNCKPWPTRGARWLRGKQARRSRKRFPQGTKSCLFFAPFQILLHVFETFFHSCLRFETGLPPAHHQQQILATPTPL